MRWLKFNAIGALGMVVQFGSLAFLVHVVELHYLLATALAVEAAVLHNCFWHLRWTWADRRGVTPGAVLLRFNLTTGLVSLAGNILSTYILTGFGGLDLVVANLLSIVLCSLANFFLSDRIVFCNDKSGSV
jgi:putative flippase GtrA